MLRLSAYLSRCALDKHPSNSQILKLCNNGAAVINMIFDMHAFIVNYS